MAKKADTIIIPVYMDQLWGSIFSFSGGRFFTKKPKSFPYQFTAAIGDPIDSSLVTPDLLINTLRKLSYSCIEMTATIGRGAVLSELEKIGTQKLVFSKNGSLTGQEVAQCIMHDTISTNDPQLNAWLETLLDATRSQSKLCDFWMNAQQLDRVNALQPKKLLTTTVGNNEKHEIVASVLWPILSGTQVYVLSDEETSIPETTEQLVGSNKLCEQMRTIIPSKPIPFFDFSARSSLDLPHTACRSCFVKIGRSPV